MQEEKLKDAHKFKLWKSHLEKSGLIINNVEEVYTRRRYNGEVLFSTLMLDATTPEGDKIPPICFLKGEVVCVLICLIDDANDEKYLILVKQRRIAEGGYTYEHPAGMVDGTQTPEAISIQEVREETGIEITQEQLINLSPDKRLFPSTGTSDESMYLFAAELRMSKAKIDSYENKEMGTDYEFERITTHIFPFKEGHSLISNTNGMLLNFLYLKHVQDFELLKSL
ncbi:NUDIX domain-containing protein [Arcticibacterium luteifluviistationis]|uniref:GDP-mannose pyrophosphatase n=1 Tax=Arcticibacterium luteifluviistationis TaxID=1784714 RepID=A0A2Z4GB24_9BACT|nr:NUDIX domain-containing protein [Arcticibacterium luteifluviistationis]AWV98240.1 NUDIX hydrolase [Arcticibacterium luteifluviistationis]